jgi:competence protein ComGF
MNPALRSQPLINESTKPVQAHINQICKEEGHTLIEALMALSVMVLLAYIISFSLIPIQEKPISAQFEETNLFFTMLGKEVREGVSIEVRNNMLYITHSNGDVISFSKYHNLVRKQVNGLGHEIWVQNIREMQMNKHSDLILTVVLIDFEGNEFKRFFRRLK